jgi:hypothetical protein
MKKYAYLIMLPGMIFLFTMCRKEIKTQKETDTSKFKLAAAAIAVYDWEFNTSGNFEGWTWGNATAAVSGGALNLTTTSTDPLIMSPDNLNITAPATYKFVQVNLKNNSSVTSARIFFTTTADTNWSQAKSKGFTINANTSSYASYIVDMSTVAGWSGTIKRIRIDPLDPAGGSGQTVNIDLIRITETVTNINEWLFDNNTNDLEGWTAGNATATVSGGTLNVTTTGVDPLLLSPDNLGITTPAIYKFVQVEMQNNTPDTSGRIFFITNTDTVWNAAKSKSFKIKPNSNYYGSYIVDMSTVAGWTGTIRRIRVDPLDPAVGVQMVKIDLIRITNNQSYRGVVSPQGDVTAADANILKNQWKANVMRWQIMSPTGRPDSLDGFDTWLDQEITQLDNAFTVCEPLGIKLLIDMHYTPMGGNTTVGQRIFYNKAANDKLVASWYKLANRYKDRSGLYGYGLINEPVQPTTPPAGLDFKSTEIRIGDTIRSIDRKTPIFISVDQGDHPFGFVGFTPVPLTNVIYEVHMYEPMAYTFQRLYPDTTTTAYTYPGMVGTKMYNKAQLTTELNAVHDFQTNYSARIHVGEFSVVRWADGGATWLRDCMEIFEGYGWSWTYFAYKESDFFDLTVANNPIRPITPAVNTDRYNQVVGWGLNLNQ